MAAAHWPLERVLECFRAVNATQMRESENREYEPLVLSKARAWRIVGKVLWPFRQTP